MSAKTSKLTLVHCGQGNSNEKSAGRLALCTQGRVASRQPSNVAYASLLMGIAVEMYMKWNLYALQFM